MKQVVTPLTYEKVSSLSDDLFDVNLRKMYEDKVKKSIEQINTYFTTAIKNNACDSRVVVKYDLPKDMDKIQRTQRNLAVDLSLDSFSSIILVVENRFNKEQGAYNQTAYISIDNKLCDLYNKGIDYEEVDALITNWTDVKNSFDRELALVKEQTKSKYEAIMNFDINTGASKPIAKDYSKSIVMFDNVKNILDTLPNKDKEDMNVEDSLDEISLM